MSSKKIAHDPPPHKPNNYTKQNTKQHRKKNTMPTIIRQPDEIQNTIIDLNHIKNQLNDRANYHKTQLTKHALEPDHTLPPHACGEAKNANQDLLDHINTTANMLAQEYENLANRIQNTINQLQETQNRYHELDTNIINQIETTQPPTLLDKIKNIF